MQHRFRKSTYRTSSTFRTHQATDVWPRQPRPPPQTNPARLSTDHGKCTRTKIRDGQVANRPVYVAMGISIDGERDVLGLWAGPTGGEGAKQWMSMLTELRNRGVADVCIVCCDGLKGLPDAIAAILATGHRSNVCGTSGAQQPALRVTGRLGKVHRLRRERRKPNRVAVAEHRRRTDNRRRATGLADHTKSVTAVRNVAGPYVQLGIEACADQTLSAAQYGRHAQRHEGRATRRQVNVPVALRQ